MYRRPLAIISNQQGIGLIAALFVIVILSLFGVIVARFTQTTSVASAEDYLWAQTYYSAESALRLRILEDDGGGNWSGWTNYPTSLGGATITEVSFSSMPVGQPSSVKVKATIINIVRSLEVKYIK
jgi:hypothetical protein